MKEYLHTIPVNDAFLSGDECPFCYLAREAERNALRYVAGPGASYMEPDVRQATDAVGFCQKHMKQLFDYGNSLGAALMLQTHYTQALEQLRSGAEDFTAPPKRSFFARKRKAKPSPLAENLAAQVESCYICNKIQYNMDRYYRTFFALLKEPEFRERVLASKGFCLKHFSQLLDQAQVYLPNEQREWFYGNLFPLMLDNLERVKADLDWFVAKYDYRNISADWKNSKDALQRTMQKLTGGHPADKPYKNE